MPLLFFCRRILCARMETELKYILVTVSQHLLKLEIGGPVYKVRRISS